MFSRKMMFKRAEQMEVAAVRRLSGGRSWNYLEWRNVKAQYSVWCLGYFVDSVS
jgi:hypothetical protein